jgi:hypothetical protein
MKVRQRLSVSKRAEKKIDLERYNVNVEVEEDHQVKISNSFAASENLDNDVDINRAWRNITENMKASNTKSLGHYEVEQHKPRFDYRYFEVEIAIENQKRYITVY